ncbi:MAG: type 1 glutamine amidotransferase [Nitrospira sp.]|nr:type 1 glutamine amidotransferase [Nitrospira sp.]
MRAVCLQHVAFEGPGVFARFLEQRDYRLERYLVPESGLPDDAGDFLLVMGGPMSVNDPDAWIRAELAFIKKAVESGIPYVGICLGSQLLAKALGGKVRPGPKLELGITPVVPTVEGRQDQVFKTVPEPWAVFEWHGEVFDLPPGAVPLAANDVCIQAFRYGPKAYGLLFHPEMEQAGIEVLCRECPGDVARAKTNEAALIAQALPHLPRLHLLTEHLINSLAS